MKILDSTSWRTFIPLSNDVLGFKIGPQVSEKKGKMSKKSTNGDTGLQSF